MAGAVRVSIPNGVWITEPAAAPAGVEAAIRSGDLAPLLVTDLALLAEIDDDLVAAAQLLGTSHAAYAAAGRISDPDDKQVLTQMERRLDGALGSDRLERLRSVGHQRDAIEVLREATDSL